MQGPKVRCKRVRGANALLAVPQWILAVAVEPAGGPIPHRTLSRHVPSLKSHTSSSDTRKIGGVEAGEISRQRIGGRSNEDGAARRPGA
eukprot:363864-Chlamydomonas_euryale.AAC.25